VIDQGRARLCVESSRIAPRGAASGLLARPGASWFITRGQAVGRRKVADVTSIEEQYALPSELLRWRCAPESISADSTDDIEPIPDVIGQETAVEALRFGLETDAPGQNIFVRGLTGTGRMTLLRRLLQDIQPACPQARDRCYVRNFQQPDRPKLITLPRGQGRRFKRAIHELADFIRDDLRQAMNADPMRARRSALEKELREQTEKIIKPFDSDLRDAGLAVVTLNDENAPHAAIFPLVEGKPVAPEEFESLHRNGQIDEATHQNYHTNREQFQERFEAVTAEVHRTQREFQQRMQKLIETEVRALLFDPVARIVEEIPEEAVKSFLQELVDDVVNERLGDLQAGRDFTRHYRVNLILEHQDDGACPIIVENTPTVANLLGAIDREVLGDDQVMIADHLTIRAGSLMRADGGYLILDARDVLTEPGAWKMLSRTLRTGRLEIVPSETQVPWAAGYTLKPEPIDIEVKVILIGDGQIYHLLDQLEYEFPNLFKVLADFDAFIARNQHAIDQYAGVLSRIVHEEDLPAFDRTAITTLVEHGARIADRSEKITSNFGRLADLAREAAFLSRRANAKGVSGEHVGEAIRRTRRRADLPARRFREFLAQGTIRVQTEGTAPGQINGLAVLQSGPLTYGFPARITATIGPGTAGVISIEREAALSGAIHTKGFYILGGLLRTLLQTDHPLAFSASIAFEQSYGGIDGDSASAAEICSLISALTRVPIRQDLAMTGAIDQTGTILAVGAVTAKVEGFYDVCKQLGFTGTQGVIIPKANAGDLMLREDVVETCRRGDFHVYAVDTIHEALAIVTGIPPGEMDNAGDYPEGTLLHLAKKRARTYWEQARAVGRPPVPAPPPAEQPNDQPPDAPAPTPEPDRPDRPDQM